MPDDEPATRRRFLHWSATAALLGLAGCGGGGDAPTNETDGAGGEETIGEGTTAGDATEPDEETTAAEGEETTAVDGEETTTAAEEETTAGDGTATGDVPAEVSDYLSDAGNFDGSVADETGSGSVEVDVGAQGNDGNFAFEPPAVRVDAGTEVTWVWTGEGGQHNVVHEDGAFESELTEEQGFEFSHTFEESGNYLYFCEPHKSLGMKGAVIVA
jgi:halocyanin-like protein